MRTRQARQSASTTVYDDGPRSAGPADAAGADTLDLATLPSVELTSDIIRHLLENIQDGSAISKHEESSSSSSSSTSVPLQRPARKKTAKAAVPSKSDGAPLRELEMQQDGHNIYPSTTKHDRREKHTDGSTSADVLDSEAGADQREGAVGVTRRTCSHCGRLFKRASDCRRHERIHTNDKPHPCPIPECGKAFVQKSALTTHLRTHTGEKPYTCRKGNCSRTFADASSRKKHESTHDKDDKRYPCLVCPRQAFRRRDTLSLHMKRMHPEVAFAGFSDGPDNDLDMTSEADAYATSEIDAEYEDTTMPADEESLLHFSSWPTDYSVDTAMHYAPLQADMPASASTELEDDDAFAIQTPLARSQSAPADEHPPSSPGPARSLSAPLTENVIEPSGSLADIASLFFESSGASSTASSQSSVSTVRSSNPTSSRYPFMYRAPPLHRSTRGNHSDGENDRTLARTTSRPSTSSAEDLFELLYAPPTPVQKSGHLASHNQAICRTAPQARQPLSRVPSFGTPWAPGSPPKAQPHLFRELNDMFT